MMDPKNFFIIKIERLFTTDRNPSMIDGFVVQCQTNNALIMYKSAENFA